MNTNGGPVEFATVFRHELAAIADRRRVQRMEALGRLKADGDYSQTAVRWADDAAEQEVMLAKQAASAVDGLLPLIEPFLTDEVDVAKVVAEFRRLSERPDPPHAGSDSPAGGGSSHTGVRNAAAAAADALKASPVVSTGERESDEPESRSGAEAAREVLNHIFRVLVVREPKAPPVGKEKEPDATAATFENLQRAVNAVKDLSLRAAQQRIVVRTQSDLLKTAAACNASAEMAAKVRAIASLVNTGESVDQYEIFASAAAATNVVLLACKNVKTADASNRQATNVGARLYETALHAVEMMADAFSAVTRQFIPNITEDSLADLARKALKEVLHIALGVSDLPVHDVSSLLFQAESSSTEDLAQETLARLTQAVAALRGERPALVLPVGRLELLEAVEALSGQCRLFAFQLLSREYAGGVDPNAPSPEPRPLNAREAKQIAAAGVQELAKAAIVVAELAWAAETQAGAAIRAATGILVRRFKHDGTSAAPPPTPKPDLDHLRSVALERGLVGVAFCGGGIRSATFGLGVLQALGQLRLLRFVDYCSTVSGGGYIGSWLAAWIHREQNLVNVEKQLDPSRIQQATAARIVKVREDAATSPAHRLRAGAIDDEPEPVQHLRAYSRYLAPRLFSADTWTLGAIYLRNLVVNLVSLAPWVFSLLLVSRLVVWGFTRGSRSDDDALAITVAAAYLLFALGLFIWAYRQRARLRESFRDPLKHPDGADRLRWGGGVLLITAAVLTTLTGLWLLSYSPPNEAAIERWSGADCLTKNLPLRHPRYHWLNFESPFRDWPAIGKFVFFSLLGPLALSLLGGAIRCLIHRQFRRALFGILVLADGFLGLGLGLFVYLVLEWVVWPLGTDAAAVVTLGFPAMLMAMVLADYLEMVFIGSFLDESEREWRSRIAAYLFMIALGWLGFFSATLYFPWWLQHLRNPLDRAAVFSSAAGIWAILSGFGAWAGRWLQGKSAAGWSIPWLRLSAAVAPPVFLIGVLALGAMLTFQVAPISSDDYLEVACVSSLCAGGLLLRWLAVGVVGVAAVWNLIRVNFFSLHMLYANRLIRCYLGASRRKQNWNRRASGPIGSPTGDSWWLWGPGTRGGPTNADASLDAESAPRRIARREPTFTDFDPADDLLLHDLQAVGPAPSPSDSARVQPDQGYRGPYPLLNTAMNLVGSPDLAIQDRRAASFVLTPDFCGSPTCGYARTRGEQLTLGRAMTISGAAVDPNMGLFYSPQLTALMTILNTRLGWWLQNPNWWREEWNGSGPGAEPLLLFELLGQTNESSRYVHLSDGGHFENLGVYELIRRRCRYIVVTDVTEDRHAATDNLANLIRLVRTDFGVNIQMETEQLAEGPDGRSRWHCAIGLIHYEDIDPQALSGSLVYMYSSLTGDEPPDVQQYAQANPAFPHETTLDQFFGEAQFESYRALGFHIATEVFGAAARTMNRDCCDSETAQEEVRGLFSTVRKRWFPAPPGSEKQFLPAANLYLDVERHLREKTFQRLREELYPEIRGSASAGGPSFPLHGVAQDGSTSAGGAENPPARQVLDAEPSHQSDADLQMVSEMLQVMQMVWFGMKLDSYHAHSLNRGWMNLFRRWTSAATFHRHWPFLRGEFSQDFVRFCEQALNMTPTDVVAQRIQSLVRPNWLTEVREMDLEFAQEWTSERDRLGWLTTGRYLIDRVAVSHQFQKANALSQPLIWRLVLRDDFGAVMGRSSGMICVGPPYLGAGRDLELFVWLRGSYRNFGVGRLCLPEILRTIAQELGGSQYRLLTYYPDGGTDKAERLAMAQWKNFFFDHKFRSVSADDPCAVPGVVALMRKLD